MIDLIICNALSECYQQAEGIQQVKRFLEPLNMFNLELNEIPQDILEELKSTKDLSDKIKTSDYYDDDPGNFKDKRSGRPSSPCSCDYEYDLLDLGSSVYPRYHQQKICAKNSRNHHCTFGSKCKELEHKVLVLTEISEGINLDKFFNFDEKKFNWTLIDIKVDCRCTHAGY